MEILNTGRSAKTLEFIRRAILIHEDKFDYTESVVEKLTLPVKIWCRNCDKFIYPKASDHLRGCGCKSCSARSKKTISQLINEFIEKHGNKYKYDRVYKYKGSRQIIEIFCTDCQVYFSQTIKCHLRGMGCTTCGYIVNAAKRRMDWDPILKILIEKYGEKYDYTNVKYESKKHKIPVLCNGCQEIFYPRVKDHIRDHDCPLCYRRKLVSKVETEWLNIFNIETNQRNRFVKAKNKRYNADGLDEENKTIYEFYGDYWHGNPAIYNDELKINHETKTTFKELYDRTIRKENNLLASGYKLIIIWERKFKQYKKDLKTNPSISILDYCQIKEPTALAA